MTYTDMLQVDGRYESSINLQYDIGNLHKIDCYIPTDQSVQILKEYLSAILYGNKSEYATVLIGPYGKGKSHLILVLLSLLASTQLFTEPEDKAECTAVLNRLVERIEKVDSEAASLAREILSRGKPLLPVIVDSNATEINQVLILALRNALDRYGCGNLLPEMNFDVALKMIERWKADYPDAYARLQTELLPHKYSVEDMKDGLGSYSRAAYNLFVTVYPTVTSGSTFAPIFFEDAIQLYKSVNNALVTQTDFGGMFVVYDEFSKFLEANLDKSKMLNFKVIQELAELSARSAESELLFCCITHKDLLSYSSSDSFRTVVGRFKQIEYVHSSEQAYELIANAIEKKAGYPGFLEDNNATFERVKKQVYASGLFRSLEDSLVENIILKGCFPLAPMTAFGLLRISEKVAQNERTLFTFLAGHECDSVMGFINSDHTGVEFLTLDVIYDYFAPSFSMELYNREIHSIWAKTNAALKIAETELQKQIIKALAIILIIGDEQVRPNAVSLKTALLITDDLFMEATDRLCALQVLTKRDISGEYAFLTPNGVDIRNNLENYIQSKLPRIQVCEELERFIGQEYVLPRQYNNQYKIIRYFRRVFMDAALFCAYGNGNEILRSLGADGVIIQIIAFSEADRTAVMAHYQKMEQTNCVLVAISEEDFSFEMKLKELVAIQALKQADIVRADAHYAEELEIYEEDLLRFLRKQIAWAYSSANEACKYYYEGEWIVSLTKGIFLSRFISGICDRVYNRTPIINNEMINKTTVTGPIKKARMLIVNKLIQTAVDTDIVWEGYGPEVSIYRSLIANKQLDGLNCESDANLAEVLAVIDDFVRQAVGNRRKMSELYSRLLSAPYAIKKGVIPVYIAYVLRRIEGVTTLYWGEREFLLSADVLENVDSDPEKYELYIDEATEEKEEYLNRLCELFGVNASVSDRNGLIVIAMQRWIRSLPKVTRDARKEYGYSNGQLESNTLPLESVKLRRALLAFDVNVRELLMERIPQDIFNGASFEVALSRIEQFREHLDCYLPRLKSTLINYAIGQFVSGYEGSLSQAINIWKEERTDRSLKKLYDTQTNLLLKYLSDMDTNDDEAIISRIALALTGFSIEDWNDESTPDFCRRLHQALERVAGAETEEAPKSDSSISITISRNNQSVERMVESREISLLGKTLMSNLRYSFEEYGGSITPEEKASILVELLKEVIGEA